MVFDDWRLDKETELHQHHSPALYSQAILRFVKINGKRLRIVHIPHELGSKVPLLVFIHGVGGQLEQFEKQIEYFSHSTHILAMDMCGFGGSDVPEGFEHYTTDAYVQDIITLLQRYKSDDTVLICHSYGCAIGTLLYSRLELSAPSSSASLLPTSAPMSINKGNLSRTPDWVINMARILDRWGGTHSKSVERLVHPSAGIELRRRQLEWNKASKTFVLRRLFLGVQYPTEEDFKKIQCPLLIMTGEDDRVCPVIEATQIHHWCRTTNAQVKPPLIIPMAGHQTMVEKSEHVTPIISTFLINDCSMSTMDPSWQITVKSQQENKWSLKNTEKWLNTPSISSPIGRGPGKFRAMKVLRQSDPNHSPSAFLAQHPEVGIIVDISSREPSYRTTDFEATSITYTKLPSVSKIPPTWEDVNRFIAHCNACWEQKPGVDLAVHCHYGFNRTGFMICSYLIQEQKYSVAEALQHFEQARPPRGIRHDHFKGELYLRYEPPLQLATTS
ncbi:Alpha/Beta hydrolase protein [Mortierella sp. GBAus27b]|nr:Alpha/Beta hydrolase protein [Mortierella sp. GBAus27b]